MRNQKGKTELQKNVHRRICVRDITVFDCTLFFQCVFAAFFGYSLSLPKWRICRMTPIKIYILLCVVFCLMISLPNSRKYENLLQFNTTHFFYKQCFFSTHPQCCLVFSLTELQMLLRWCLIHITIIIHFILSIFASMSRPSSIYVVYMWSLFCFRSHFNCHWQRHYNRRTCFLYIF